jgi:hypothetical protein
VKLDRAGVGSIPKLILSIRRRIGETVSPIS